MNDNLNTAEGSNQITIDRDFIAAFERGLNPTHPERSDIPAQVLGYGEVSTVLTIPSGDPGIVYKRMPMFRDQQEIKQFSNIYTISQQLFHEAGIKMVQAGITYVIPQKGNLVFYIIQRKLNSETLANKAIHQLDDAAIRRLFAAILAATGLVFDFNQNHADLELGFDAQLANWSISNFDPQTGHLPEKIELTYVDTSSPFLRLYGQEQLERELFLRSMPSFMRWIGRQFFLDDIFNRYYDHKQVIVDILANLFKEKRGDMIPDLINPANDFLLSHRVGAEIQTVSEKEVADYYSEDAFIWTLYLASRRLDRQLHHILRKPYPYVLPGHIDR